MADNRAVSEVLSYILVFTLIVSSVAVVSVSGLDSLEDAKNAQQMGNAERAFDIIADNMADIYQRGARSRATEVDVRESQLAVGNQTDINVTVNGESENETTRQIILTGEQDRQLVYEGGAVFRENRDGAITLREPPFIVRDDKVLIQLISTTSPGQQSLGGSTVLLRAQRTDERIRYNNTSATGANVNITIRSPRYQQWNQTLAEPNYDCVDAGTQAIRCELTGSFERIYIVSYNIEIELEP